MTEDLYYRTSNTTPGATSPKMPRKSISASKIVGLEDRLVRKQAINKVIMNDEE